MFVYEIGTSPVTAVAFLPTGDALAATREGKLLRIAPFQEPELVLEEPGIHALAVNDSTVAIASQQGWRLHPNDAPAADPRKRPVAAVRFIDAQRLAVGFGDPHRAGAGSFELWNLVNGNRLTPHFAEPHGIRAVDSLGPLVAWATGHQKLMVWDTTKPDTVTIPLKHTATSVAFHPDATRLVVNQGWNAKIVSIKTRFEHFTLSGHKGRVSCVAVHPDGSQVATGSWDGSVRLWSAATGEPLGFRNAPLGRVTALAVNHSQLLAGGDNGNLAAWDLE